MARMHLRWSLRRHAEEARFALLRSLTHTHTHTYTRIAQITRNRRRERRETALRPLRAPLGGGGGGGDGGSSAQPVSSRGMTQTIDCLTAATFGGKSSVAGADNG